MQLDVVQRWLKTPPKLVLSIIRPKLSICPVKPNAHEVPMPAREQYGSECLESLAPLRHRPSMKPARYAVWKLVKRMLMKLPRTVDGENVTAESPHAPYIVGLL